MKRQQGGFTLIELIMVIVILGILAAFALPKFADFSGQARYSTINGALGSVRSASAIVHSAALAGNQTGPTGSVTLEGTSIDLAYGYIEGDAATLRSAAQLSTDFTVAGTATVTVTLGGCSFTYVAPTTATGATSAPVISAITGNTGTSCGS